MRFLKIQFIAKIARRSLDHFLKGLLFRKSGRQLVVVVVVVKSTMRLHPLILNLHQNEWIRHVSMLLRCHLVPVLAHGIVQILHVSLQ